MKKLSILLIGCLAGTSALFTACDEDYPGPNPVDVTAHYSNYSSNAASYLELTYNGKAMSGKSVDFSTVAGETANLTFYDVIPGEKSITITSVPLSGDAEGYSFSGSGAGENTSSSFNFEGRAVKGKLTLTLSDVKMGNAELWAKTYAVTNVVERGPKQTVKEEKDNDTTTYVWTTSSNELLKSPCYLDAELELTKECYDAQSSLKMLQGILGYILPQYLKDITLDTDGTISASFSSDKLNAKQIVGVLLMGLSQSHLDAVLEGRTYKSSQSTDFVYWYPKDGHLMLKIDLVNIIARIAGGNDGQQISKEVINGLVNAIVQMDALRLKSLLATLNESLDNEILGALVNIDDDSFQTVLKWLGEGIPAHVEMEEGQTRIYVDKEVLTPLFKLLPVLAPLIKDALPAGGNMIQSMLTSLSELPSAVKTFRLGLEFDGTNN